jgi:hypothetical protein
MSRDLGCKRVLQPTSYFSCRAGHRSMVQAMQLLRVVLRDSAAPVERALKVVDTRRSYYIRFWTVLMHPPYRAGFSTILVTVRAGVS